MDEATEATGEQTSHTGRLIPDDIWGILCIFAEARGEPYEGQVAVGNVIRNRTRRRFSSDGTVVGTVVSPFQFSWTNQGDRQRTRVFAACWEDLAMQQCVRAWFESEFRQEVPDDTLWYHSGDVDPVWSKSHGMILLKRIANHIFYRERVEA